jgi:hypothetical protein
MWLIADFLDAIQRGFAEAEPDLMEKIENANVS